MLPLARVYGLPLDHLVGAPPAGDPRIHLRPVERLGLSFVALIRGAGGIGRSRVGQDLRLGIERPPSSTPDAALDR